MDLICDHFHKNGSDLFEFQGCVENLELFSGELRPIIACLCLRNAMSGEMGGQLPDDGSGSGAWQFVILEEPAVVVDRPQVGLIVPGEEVSANFLPGTGGNGMG